LAEGDLLGARQNAEASLKVFQQVHGGATAVHANIAGSLYNLGVVSYKEGKFDQALECFEKCLAMRRQVYGGPEVVHDDSRHTLSWLGRVAVKQGDLRRGAARSREAWVMACKIYGAEHKEAVKEKELLHLVERFVAGASVSANE
jgi:tetratricopeptide (TPR) repeat protein